MRRFRIIVEKHPNGYVVYPLGPKGIVVREGDTHEEALADVKSASQFHIEIFGLNAVLDVEVPVEEQTVWSCLTAEQFFAGYSEADSIYDRV